MAKESNFKKLQNSVAKEYEKKGMSKKQAEKVGGAVAYNAGKAKYGKAGMAARARAGRRGR